MFQYNQSSYDRNMGAPIRYIHVSAIYGFNDYGMSFRLIPRRTEVDLLTRFLYPSKCAKGSGVLTQ